MSCLWSATSRRAYHWSNAAPLIVETMLSSHSIGGEGVFGTSMWRRFAVFTAAASDFEWSLTSRAPSALTAAFWPFSWASFPPAISKRLPSIDVRSHELSRPETEARFGPEANAGDAAATAQAAAMNMSERFMPRGLPRADSGFMREASDLTLSAASRARRTPSHQP